MRHRWVCLVVQIDMVPDCAPGVLLPLLKELDILGKLSEMFYKRDNLNDTLFALLHNKSRLIGNKFFPFRVDAWFQEGDKSTFDRAASLKICPLPLSYAKLEIVTGLHNTGPNMRKRTFSHERHYENTPIQIY